jgi:hypothetical protein
MLKSAAAYPNYFEVHIDWENFDDEAKGLITFPGKISVRREATDAAVDDEGIALAIPEETNAADGNLAVDRKLTEKVIKSETKSDIVNFFWKRSYPAPALFQIMETLLLVSTSLGIFTFGV